VYPFPRGVQRAAGDNHRRFQDGGTWFNFPAAAGEILVDRVRQRISPLKAMIASDWLEVYWDVAHRPV